MSLLTVPICAMAMALLLFAVGCKKPNMRQSSRGQHGKCVPTPDLGELARSMSVKVPKLPDSPDTSRLGLSQLYMELFAVIIYFFWGIFHYKPSSWWVLPMTIEPLLGQLAVKRHNNETSSQCLSVESWSNGLQVWAKWQDLRFSWVKMMSPFESLCVMYFVH